MRQSALAILLATFGTLALSEVDPREQIAIVTRVIDGDTLEVELAGLTERVRLIGVDTPENHDPRKPVEAYANEAGKFTRRLVQGKKVFLRDDHEGMNRDRYGRLLRYVYLANDETFVNAEIIKHGYSRAYVRYPFSYQDEFRAYERQARERGLGIWSNGGSTRLPDHSRPRQDSEVVGSSQSKKYHRLECPWASRIDPANRVTFESYGEAQREGYVPCMICKPPSATNKSADDPEVAGGRELGASSP